MAAEWLLSALIIAIATPTFGHFEAVRPTWTRILRWLAYLAVTGVLGVTVGRPWTLIWVLGLPAVGAVFHLIWCLRHGIDPITAEPRGRDEQFRRRPVPAGGQTMTGHTTATGLAGTRMAGRPERNSRYLAGGPGADLGFMASRSSSASLPPRSR